MNPIVAALWWVGLLATLVGFLPNLVAWLGRTLSAAQQIEQYTAEILMATEGIAANTTSASALHDTVAAASPLLARAEALERHAAEIEQATAPPGEGSGSGPEV